jgi:hypothetical protein
VALALLGITWASACLVVPPLVVNWMGPLVTPPVIGRDIRRDLAPVPRRSAAVDRRRTSPVLEPPRRIDLYGNEIANPVARYRVDDRGALYEVHSPETEVPRLGPPGL